MTAIHYLPNVTSILMKKGLILPRLILFLIKNNRRNPYANVNNIQEWRLFPLFFPYCITILPIHYLFSFLLGRWRRCRKWSRVEWSSLNANSGNHRFNGFRPNTKMGRFMAKKRKNSRDCQEQFYWD